MLKTTPSIIFSTQNKFTCCFLLTPPLPHPYWRCNDRDNDILSGTVVKTKVYELEEEVREVFTRRLSKDLTGMVELVYGNKRFLVRFWYGFDNYMILNQLTIMIVDMIPMTEEYELTMIYEIPDGPVDFYKG